MVGIAKAGIPLRVLVKHSHLYIPIPSCHLSLRVPDDVSVTMPQLGTLLCCSLVLPLCPSPVVPSPPALDVPCHTAPVGMLPAPALLGHLLWFILSLDRPGHQLTSVIDMLERV